MLEAMNLVVIMDDEHNKKMLGHAGHPRGVGELAVELFQFRLRLL